MPEKSFSYWLRFLRSGTGLWKVTLAKLKTRLWVNPSGFSIHRIHRAFPNINLKNTPGIDNMLRQNGVRSRCICEERDSGGGTVTKRFFSKGEQQGVDNFYYTRDHLGSPRINRQYGNSSRRAMTWRRRIGANCVRSRPRLSASGTSPGRCLPLFAVMCRHRQPHRLGPPRLFRLA